MRYLDRLVLQELINHHDPDVRKKAEELLKLLETGKTPEATEKLVSKPRRLNR